MRRSYRNLDDPDQTPSNHTYKKITKTWTTPSTFTEKVDSEQTCYCDVGRDHQSVTIVNPFT